MCITRPHTARNAHTPSVVPMVRAVSADDWYRSADWDADAQAFFERKLARATAHKRPQYLRIKGLALLETDDPELQNAGVRLMRRVISEYPDSTFDVSVANGELAERAATAGNIDTALELLRAVMRAELGTNISGTPELRLAEVILQECRTDLLAEAEIALGTVLTEDPILGGLRFRYAVARARLAALTDEPDEAAAFALGALHLAAVDAPISSAHPTFGRVDGDDDLFAELEALADAGDAEAVSPLTDDFRGIDGEVVWDWRLIERLRWTDDDPLSAQQDALRREAQPIVEELRAAGFDVIDLEAFSLRMLPTAAAARTAAPILLRGIERASDPDLQAILVTALADRRVRAIATAPLLDMFGALRDPALNGHDRPSEAVGAQRGLRSALGSALSTLARDEHFTALAALLRDPAYGYDRVYLLWALEHVEHPDAVDLAIELLDDEDLNLNALRTLGDLRSERAAPVFAPIAATPKPRGRSDEAEMARIRIKVAERGLEKLEKARAAGKSRP